jgi:hypothetical protein
MDIEAGRPDDAAKRVTTGLAVSGSLSRETELIGQLIRITVGEWQLDVVHRLVTQYEPSRPSLEELARWLDESGTPEPGQVGLLGELRHINWNWARVERGNIPPVGAEPSFWVSPLARLGRPFARLARARALQQIGELLDIQSGPRPRPARLAAGTPARWSLLARLDFLSGSGFERAMDACDQFNSAIGATELAVALRRFKIDHGSYPDALSALAPAYVASVPIDPFTGRPPVYSREGAGFQLHAQGGKNAPRQMASALTWSVPK